MFGIFFQPSEGGEKKSPVASLPALIIDSIVVLVIFESIDQTYSLFAFCNCPFPKLPMLQL